MYTIYGRNHRTSFGQVRRSSFHRWWQQLQRFITTTNNTATATTLSVDEVFYNNTEQQQQTNDTDISNILRPYYEAQRPVVIRDAVQSAPATQLWSSSWEYWYEIVKENDKYLHGNEIDDEKKYDNDDTTTSMTMVAVEMGGSYGSATSERAEIPFQSYLQYLQLLEERHGRMGDDIPFKNKNDSSSTMLSSWSIPSNELVYMAQNDLLQPLYKDIIIPNFCQDIESNDDATLKVDKHTNKSSSTTKLGLGHLYSVMLWLGPRGCVSPLHYDPLDNCLMQHMGRKRVLLYEPTSTDDLLSSYGCWHYAGHDGQQSNTSPINPEILDDMLPINNHDNTKEILQKRYPLFYQKSPPRMECILNPGDMLYIPAKWWHHTRSIDTSASVNVWWR